jgi:hypothetical protein
MPRPPPRIEYGAGSDLPLEGGETQLFPSPSGRRNPSLFTLPFRERGRVGVG